MNNPLLAQISRYFSPSLIGALLGYNKARFSTDIVAGIIALAIAIASGAKPEAGIFTAIIAGFIIAAFGNSRVKNRRCQQALIIMAYNIIVQHGR